VSVCSGQPIPIIVFAHHRRQNSLF